MSLMYVNIADPNSDIVYVMYRNYFDDPSRYGNNESTFHQVLDMTWQNLVVAAGGKFNFAIGDDLIEVLKHLADKANHAIVIAPGTTFKSDFIKLIKTKLAITFNDYFLIGHILDKKESYYTCHGQTFILNLKRWAASGFIDPGQPGKTVKYKIPTRSVENFHDDYTPISIKLDKTAETKTYVKTRWGHKWINYGLTNHAVYMFDADLRKYKHYLYTENPGFVEFWQGYWHKNKPIDVNNEFANALRSLKGRANYRELYKENNENIPADVNFKNLDFVVAAASGWWVNSFLDMYPAQDLSKVVYYDIYDKALEFRKSATNTKDFKTWDLYEKIPKEYHQLDVISEVDKFTNIIPKNKTGIIWLTNIFTFTATVSNYSSTDILYAWLRLIKTLKQTHPDSIIHGKDPFNRYILSKLSNYEVSLTSLLASNYFYSIGL